MTGGDACARKSGGVVGMFHVALGEWESAVASPIPPTGIRSCIDERVCHKTRRDDRHRCNQVSSMYQP